MAKRNTPNANHNDERHATTDYKRAEKEYRNEPIGVCATPRQQGACQYGENSDAHCAGKAICKNACGRRGQAHTGGTPTEDAPSIAADCRWKRFIEERSFEKGAVTIGEAWAHRSRLEQ